MEDSLFEKRLSADAEGVTQVVEDEVLPRLAAAHRDAEPGDLPTGCINPEAVRTLAEFAVGHDLSKARALIDARRADGLLADTLMLEYLKPAARWLGELWTRDALNFTEVTIGVGRLQEIQRALAEELERDARMVAAPRRMLLAPVPGDQHTFGISMVASFLRRDGWDVSGGPVSNEKALLSAVSAERFDSIGLSVACDRWAEPLDRLVARLRDASLNPELTVLLGGPLLVEHPGLAEEFGVDAGVTDAHRADALATEAIARRS